MADPTSHDGADVEPLVPLAVWPCADPTQPTPSTEPGLLTPALARRLLATFTRPGDAVWDLTGSGVQAAARALGRHPTAYPAGSVRLAVTLHPVAAPAPDWAARDWPRVLTPGGLLAVCTRSRPIPVAHKGDSLAVAVAAAQRAGLRYLQHVIALTAPIRDSRLQAPAASRPTGQPGGGPRHRRVHTDVLVFLNAAEPSPRPSSAPRRWRRRDARDARVWSVGGASGRGPAAAGGCLGRFGDHVTAVLDPTHLP